MRGRGRTGEMKSNLFFMALPAEVSRGGEKRRKGERGLMSTEKKEKNTTTQPLFPFCPLSSSKEANAVRWGKEEEGRGCRIYCPIFVSSFSKKIGGEGGWYQEDEEEKLHFCK